MGVPFLNKIPVPFTVLEVVLVIGVIYHFAFEARKPLPVHSPNAIGIFEIPQESLAPDEVAGESLPGELVERR